MTHDPQATTPAAATEPLAPLWSDQRIMELARTTGNPYVAAAMRSGMLQVRHDYEQERQRLTAHIAELTEQVRVERNQLREEVDGLRAVIAYIDKYAPRADNTCEESGITLSEAARRAMKDEDANE